MTPPFHQPGRDDAQRGRTPNPVWVQPQVSPSYVGAPTQSVPAARRRSPWLWVIVVCTGLFVLALSNCAGFVVGIAASGQAPAALATAQQDLEVATVEVEQAQAEEAQARELVAACEQEAEALQDDLDEAEAVAATGGTELETANARVVELEASLAAVEARIVELEASLVSAQAAPAPVPAPAPAAAPAPAPAAAPAPVPAPARPAPVAGSGASGGGAVYYPNCTAARNAGAAPVRRGQPGYGSHLDRDNDGVGCE